jgi:two-component system cell cycle response regulator
MKILIAQEEEVVRGMLEATLAKWGHEIIATSDGGQAWKELQKEGAPRLAILDRTMPGMEGMAVCREVRKRTETPYVYILLTMAQGQEQEMLEGMKAGVDDYLTKPVNADQLMIRVRIARRILELQEELRNAHEAIGYQTTHDPLTGMWNRTAILDGLLRELARVRREGSHVGLILAEVDHFKSINDTYGHQVGDAVLREAARRIRSIVRPYDTVGRYGGEEFLIIVPGCDTKNALAQAERLRTSLTGESMDISEWGKFTSAKEGKLQVTLSLGVAAAEKMKETEPLLHAVEAALARARTAGHNRAEVATEADFK